MDAPLDLTIVLPVKNEERNLAGCLAAIGEDFASKVILVDSGSTDRTVDIARAHGVNVIDFAWDGKFPKKRNWFLQKHRPTTKWVLFLDADEYLTDEFKAEARSVLPGSNHAGFWLCYSVYFLGRKLRGGYPLKKLALFRVDAGEYERIEEDHWSDLDMEVHEHPILNGTVGTLTSRIDHQDFRGVAHYVTKHNEYSSWEAARFLKYSGNESIRSQWTTKQKIKYRLMRSPFIGIVYFLGSYIGMGGWRDGAAGLTFAIMKMAYFTQVYCKIVELDNAQRNRMTGLDRTNGKMLSDRMEQN